MTCQTVSYHCPSEIRATSKTFLILQEINFEFLRFKEMRLVQTVHFDFFFHRAIFLGDGWTTLVQYAHIGPRWSNTPILDHAGPILNQPVSIPEMNRQNPKSSRTY